MKAIPWLVYAVLTLGIFLGFSGAAQSQYFTMPVTPDLTVGAGATADYAFGNRSRRYLDWIWIRNDCDDDLYFSLDPLGRTGTEYNLRLNGRISGNASQTQQVFSGAFRVYTLGVSNNSGATCTFTVQGGYGR